MTKENKIAFLFKTPLCHFDLDVALDIPARGVTALFGPSGCGKTTLLRCISGLNQASVGRLVVDGEIWQAEGYFRPAHRREIGYVFQEASLFPHLDVRKNLLYGSNSKKIITVHDFDYIVDMLGLGRILNRSPHNLSGGERQRVAIGRALFSEPKLLLMDEPLSALDKPTKEEIMPFIERLHENLQLPIIYVSHDMNEIEHIADYLVLMNEGKIVASGALADIQSDPNLPLVNYHDSAVSLEGSLVDYDAHFGIAKFEVHGGFLNVPSCEIAIGVKRRLKVYASNVSLSLENIKSSTIENLIPACIIDMKETNPFQVTVVLSLGRQGDGARILARITRRSWETLGLSINAAVYTQIKAVSLVRKEY